MAGLEKRIGQEESSKDGALGDFWLFVFCLNAFCSRVLGLKKKKSGFVYVDVF